jgi:ribosomal protein L11 methyltransferase
MNGKWIEIKIVTKSEAIEPVSGIFYSFDVKGIAIEDPQDIYSRKQDSLSWDFADTNIFEYGSRAAVVKGYFSQEDDIDAILKVIDEKLSQLKEMNIDLGDIKVVAAAVYEEDWATSWKKYYKPTKIGKNIVVKPTWEAYTPSKGDVIVELDPGMAFGTGTHETTMMCVGLLEKYIKDDSVVFDIGTGSGILAITASKLGASNVVGVDLDEVAVDAAIENVSINNINNVQIKHGDLVDVLEGKADIIVANIIADIVINLTSIVKPFIKENGIFITSGIIKEREKDVINALKKEGFNILEVSEMGEWAAIASEYKNV